MKDFSERIEALQPGKVSNSVLRVIADGLSTMSGVKQLGPSWRATLSYRNDTVRQPDTPGTIRRQVERIIEGPPLKSRPVASALEDVERVANFEHAFRLSVNRFRAKLSQEEAIRCSVREFKISEESELNHADLLGAADEVRSVLVSYRMKREHPVRKFVERLVASKSKLDTTQALLDYLDWVAPKEGPFVMNRTRDVITLRPGWTKKHATDDARGMTFGLDGFGKFLAETRWHSAHPSLGLDGTVKGTFDPGLILPDEWEEDLPIDKPPKPTPILPPPPRSGEGLGAHEWQANGRSHRTVWGFDERDYEVRFLKLWKKDRGRLPLRIPVQPKGQQLRAAQLILTNPFTNDPYGNALSELGDRLTELAGDVLKDKQGEFIRDFVASFPRIAHTGAAGDFPVFPSEFFLRKGGTLEQANMGLAGLLFALNLPFAVVMSGRRYICALPSSQKEVSGWEFEGVHYTPAFEQEEAERTLRPGVVIPSPGFRDQRVSASPFIMGRYSGRKGHISAVMVDRNLGQGSLQWVAYARDIFEMPLEQNRLEIGSVALERGLRDGALLSGELLTGEPAPETSNPWVIDLVAMLDGTPVSTWYAVGVLAGGQDQMDSWTVPLGMEKLGESLVAKAARVEKDDLESEPALAQTEEGEGDIIGALMDENVASVPLASPPLEASENEGEEQKPVGSIHRDIEEAQPSVETEDEGIDRE